MEQEGAIAAQPAHDPCTTHAAPDTGSPAFVDQFVAQQTAGENAFFLETEARGLVPSWPALARPRARACRSYIQALALCARESDAYPADRIAILVGVGTGHSGDGDRYVGGRSGQRPLRHRGRDIATYRALFSQETRRDSERAGFFALV